MKRQIAALAVGICMTAMIHLTSGFTTYITAYGNPLANRRRAGGSNCL